jgi:TusA-related sulfurtransferase
MSTTVDARGLSCPQPVLMALTAMKKTGMGEITVLVDTDTSRENVMRSASSQGWNIRSVDEEGDQYRIVIHKE